MKRLTIITLAASGALALQVSAFADQKMSALPLKPAPSPSDTLLLLDEAAHTLNPNGQNARRVPVSAIGGSGTGLPDQTGEAGNFLTTDGTDPSWIALTGGGDALVANPLSQFASTTSVQLANTLSNETGTGLAVFGTAPTFTTSITSPKNIFSGSVFDGFGSGSPEGVITAAVGSTYRRTDGGSNTTFYTKETGAGNTGWVASTAGTGLPDQTGNNGKYLTTDGTDPSWVTLVGGGDALLANGLGPFAATTSLSLRGVISDETGTGVLVFGTAPTFTTQITTPKVLFNSTVFDTGGSGSPEGIVTAAIGSTYRRTNGGVDSTFYRKESGTGNTGWVPTINAVPPGAVDSEQTIANTNTAWASPNHVLRQTAALTANRSSALPLADDYKKGETILYIDKVTPAGTLFNRAFSASGSDTVNGSGSYTPFPNGPGTMWLESDGVGAWVSIGDTASLVEIRDPTSGFKVNFSLAGLTADRLITLQDAAQTLAGLELSNVFTGTSQKMKHWKGTTGISVAVNAVNTTGAGVGATAALGTGSTDMGGTLTIVPAGTPGTSALYATFTFGVAFDNAPTGIVITGMNASAMNAQSSTKDILPTSISTTGFTITSGAAALVAGTTYIWTYQVLASGQ